jgi:hypothetical protein
MDSQSGTCVPLSNCLSKILNNVPHRKKRTFFFTALKLSFKREVLRELRGIITLREKVASVTKRYEEQATANKKVGAGVAAKGPEPEGKGFNHESYA